jgi:hypothetical protein
LQEHPTEYLVGKCPRAVIAQFATNWVSPGNLEMLTNLVNQLDVQPGTDLWRRVEGVWTRVVELEVEAWPNDGEEDTMKEK